MDENSRQERRSEASRHEAAGIDLLPPASVRTSAPGHHHPLRATTTRRAWRSPFVRIFGATLLSIAALVVIALAQQFAGVLTEVRQDLNHMYESRGDLARKDEVEAGRKQVQQLANNLAALRERSAFLEQQFQIAEAERKQLARELQELREWRAQVAGRRETLAPPVALGEPRAGW